MKYNTLPNADIQVSEIAFGAWAIVGGFNWGHQEEKDSIEALQAAYESGITFFDTAEAYGGGASENLINKALSDVRDKIVVATKVKPEDFAYQDVKRACEERLKALHTDRIDLLQLHWPNHDIPLEETVGALEELKSEGKISAFGVSNFGVRDLKECLRYTSAVVSNQLPYNLLWRAIEYDILPLCVERNVAVLCYSPIMQGLLAGKFTSADQVPEDRARTRHFSKERPLTRHQEDGVEQETFEAIEAIRQIANKINVPMEQVSLAWLLAQPGVASVIVGGRNREQVIKNVKAADLALSGEVLKELSAVTDHLKKLLGANPDMWQSDSRYR